MRRALLLAVWMMGCQSAREPSRPPAAAPAAAPAAPEKTPEKTAEKTVEKTMDQQTLAARLVAVGYEKLFLSLDGGELERIWKEPGAAQALEQVAAQGAPEARVLAAEALFARKQGYRPADPASLAGAYAQALRKAELANPWGMPGELDGPLGQHLVSLGEAAVPALVPLLEDTRQVTYGGSKEATVGNDYAYRVKDLAAFYLSKIKKAPLAVPESPKARDAEIAKLRKALGL